MLIQSNLHLYNHKLQKKKRMRHLIYASFSLLALFLLFHLLFFSSYFTIKEIKLAGAESISENQLKTEVMFLLNSRSFMFFKNNNIFAMPSDFLRSELKFKFPKIKTVFMKKNIFKQEIFVVLTERKSAGIICKSDEGPCFYFDSEGVIFNSSPVILGAQVLKIIENTIDANMALPKYKYTEEQIKIIGFLKDKSFEQNNVTIRSFSFLNDHGDILAETMQGFKIFFNSQIIPAEQIKVLGGILNKEVREQAQNLDYIDLRVENRAYYKFK